ncbi:FHA domain-containing protein [Cognatishimia sp. F0-27]|uniref:FHA domain-containing protein n=1 Tax=Cognatishimia sp. F0-27 TaxID=2816855 RepID=UPI001D0CA878|nr:FHA domain-containing protein [Cognatishimia sp. F0-27]MCC1493804.1 FHA domain-containing protein [Cognatishimia sp. F0-27]
MSTFRNIIARRRPSRQPEETAKHGVEPVPPMEDILPDRMSRLREERDDPPPPPLELPKWELQAPPPTMQSGAATGPEGVALDGMADLGDRDRGGIDADMEPARTPSRRKIWDLEPECASEPTRPARPTTEHEASHSASTVQPPQTRLVSSLHALGTSQTDDLGAVAREALARAGTQTAAPGMPAASPPLAAEPPEATAPGARNARVKTRLLGFHSDDLIPDAFAAERAPSAAEPVTCPVGWLVIVDGPGRGASFALVAGLSTIGRGADQTIPLSFGDDSISRDNHASIAYDEEENEVLIGHGGKSNLVRLNGKPLVSSETLSNGDQIRVGKTTLRYVALCGPDFSWAQDEDTPEHDRG